MTSFKIKFRPSSVEKKMGTVYYQIIHNRVIRQIKTRYCIYADEWDGKTSSIVIPAGIYGMRRDFLLSVSVYIRQDAERIETIISQLKLQNTEFSSDDIVAKFHVRQECGQVFVFMRSIIEQLKNLGRVRTSETYAAALSSLEKFCGHSDLSFEAIDSSLMIRYEAWLKSNGSCPNTVSFYMRIMRAVYNRAVDQGLVMQTHPFRHVYTGVAKTKKRAVSLSTLKRIKALDLSDKPRLAFARDMFFFSFYTRGMSFIDMSYLKKTDICSGRLVYKRRKTGRCLTMKWEECMAGIAVRYGRRDSKYVLPIITKPGSDGRCQAKNTLCRINRALKGSVDF